MNKSALLKACVCFLLIGGPSSPVTAEEYLSDGAISNYVSISHGAFLSADRIIVGHLGRGKAAKVQGERLVQLKKMLVAALVDEWHSGDVVAPDGKFSMLTISVYVKSKIGEVESLSKTIRFPIAKHIVRDQNKYKELLAWIDALPREIWIE